MAKRAGKRIGRPCAANRVIRRFCNASLGQYRRIRQTTVISLQKTAFRCNAAFHCKVPCNEWCNETEWFETYGDWQWHNLSTPDIMRHLDTSQKYENCGDDTLESGRKWVDLKQLTVAA